MPTPPQHLRNLLGPPYRGGGLTFSTSGTALLLSLGGRVQHIDLVHARARTLPFEAKRDLFTIALAPKGDTLLAIDTVSRVSLLSLPSGRVIGRLSLQLQDVTAAAVSPDGKLAAFATAHEVEVWKLPDGVVPSYAAFDRVARFNKGAFGRGALSWSEDSKHLAVGAPDGIVTLFTLKDWRGKLIPATLYGHRGPIVSVEFCARRGMLTLSSDGVLMCWRLRFNDLETDHDVLENSRPYVPIQAKLLSKHFVKQGGGKRAKCAALHMGVYCVGMSNGVFALYQLPEEMVDESDDFDAGLFEIGAMRKRKRDREDKNRKKARKLGSSSQSTSGGNSSGTVKNPEDILQEEEEEKDVLDDIVPRVGVTELTVLHSLSAAKSAITDIMFNPTGEWIALASSQSGQLVVWEWRSETHILKQQSHVLSANAVAFSQDGRAIVTGSTDGRVKLWGVVNGFCIATFTDHDASVTAVAFAKNDVIVSSSLDGTVRAFDTKRYRNFRIMVGPPPRRQFGSVASDLSGDIIAAGCVDTFEVCVWSLRTGQILELLNGHKGPVSSISFRPNRGTLATSSWDRTVRLWDMYERKGSCEVLEHSKEVLSVTFRPDGKEFASCTASGEIQLWDPESGIITGTIDGARDAAPGRTKDSRTVAKQKGYFQSLSYSADGRFLFAAAASKHVCVYYVAQGSRPALITKVAVTDNKSFDGLLDRLNSKNLTVSGHAVDAIADDDVDAEDFGTSRIADAKSLPGANPEIQLRRKKLLKAEVKCIRTCPTGRVWAAVTTEGVLVYGEKISDGSDDMGEMLFDPTHLDLDVTPDAARKAAAERDFLTALTVALRLNERDCLNYVVEKVPFTDIAFIVGQLPLLYFTRLALLFAWRLENTPHLEFNLKWARQLLVTHGADAHDSASDPSNVNAALRALFRTTDAHSKRLGSLADGNQHKLSYLLQFAKRVVPYEREQAQSEAAQTAEVQ
eukprot:GFKZ01008937.1.p1 GENE.GFKZ01008937.1~~GFKZ01008937.1.p1  ORF type:complete len:966 (+),score=127.01 GFKZ01008937.1:494-3391(+)